MNKKSINFMYLYRVCEENSLDIPEYIKDLDLDLLNKNNFHELINIFIGYFEAYKDGEKVLLNNIKEEMLFESENLNMNKFGAENARSISSIKFFIENLKDLFSKYESKDFISEIDNILLSKDKYFETLEKIENINSEKTLVIEEDNDLLLDILF